MVSTLEQDTGAGLDSQAKEQELETAADLMNSLKTHTELYKRYRNIPDKLKQIAIEEALNALLMKRTDLYPNLQSLDAKAMAEETECIPIVQYDMKEEGSLIDREKVDAQKIDQKFKNGAHSSAMKVKLHRKLIALRNVMVRLAQDDQFKDMEAAAIYKDPIFQAASNLCTDLVLTYASQLDLGQRRNPAEIPNPTRL